MATVRTKLSVTVFDSATVFDGLTPEDVVYRYDLPGSGITEGWAGVAVIDQVRQLSSDHWPEVEVSIDASSEITHSLVRLFANAGVSAYPAGQSPEEEPLEEEEEVAATKSSFPLIITFVCIIGIVLSGLIIWRASAGSAVEAQEVAVTETQTPASSTSVDSSDAPAPSTTAAALAELRLGQVRVKMPPGFRLEQAEGITTATGMDPDLRIYLTQDPLHGISVDLLFAELERIIAEDETLSEPMRKDSRFTYTELPGDGSAVRWETWVSGDSQLSVGCHTRVDPTTAQHAACTAATQSFMITEF